MKQRIVMTISTSVRTDPQEMTSAVERLGVTVDSIAVSPPYELIRNSKGDNDNDE